MLNLPAMSLPEAAKILFLDTSTVRYHIIRKRLRAFKWGGKWYLYKDDVETFKKWMDLFSKKKTT
jgi:excisionase family DNA binding protein